MLFISVTRDQNGVTVRLRERLASENGLRLTYGSGNGSRTGTVRLRDLLRSIFIYIAPPNEIKSPLPQRRAKRNTKTTRPTPSKAQAKRIAQTGTERQHCKNPTPTARATNITAPAQHKHSHGQSTSKALAKREHSMSTA